MSSCKSRSSNSQQSSHQDTLRCPTVQAPDNHSIPISRFDLPQSLAPFSSKLPRGKGRGQGSNFFMTSSLHRNQPTTAPQRWSHSRPGRRGLGRLKSYGWLEAVLETGESTLKQTERYLSPLVHFESVVMQLFTCNLPHVSAWDGAISDRASNTSAQLIERKPFNKTKVCLSRVNPSINPSFQLLVVSFVDLFHTIFTCCLFVLIPFTSSLVLTTHTQTLTLVCLHFGTFTSSFPTCFPSTTLNIRSPQ